MNGEPIHILLIGEPGEARRLRDLLETDVSNQFRITHIHTIEPAAERLTQEGADVLLLDIGSDQSRGRAIVQAAASAAPRLPTVVLSDSESELLAVELLQQGAQDILAKEHLDRDLLARSIRYAIERQRVQMALENLSLIDDLTGLNNRRGFLALSEQHLRLLRRRGSALLVFVDLDGLKSINDTHGHLEGNRALIETANILRGCFRNSDILARLGGDEFCVLMTDKCKDTAEQVDKRLQDRVDLTNATHGSRFRLSLSIGIADVPGVGQPSVEELLGLADALMYEQKRKKRTHASGAVSSRQEAQI